MNLSELKNVLTQVNELTFIRPNGELVPVHFHLTEIGKINKQFIDCGGTMRNETVTSMQLWGAEDVDHRFTAEKLLKIIAMAEDQLGIADSPIEVEYQEETVGKYGLSFDNGVFKLQNKYTDCLAKDKCGVPETKKKVSLSELQNSSCCTPGSGCC